MTYIIAGKLKNSTFLMVDCISTNWQNKRQTFTDKLLKLESSKDTYFTMTGNRFIDNCFRQLDFWLNYENTTSDFINNDDFIYKLIKVVQKNIQTYPDKENLQLGRNRLFFINSVNVVFYEFNINKRYEIETNRISLNENELIDSCINFGKESFELAESKKIETFCKEHISKISKNKIDFKNRFSYVNLGKDGVITYKGGFSKLSDIIAMYNELEYKEIDNKELNIEL